MIIALIVFVVLQILLDIYFFWFIILANTTFQAIRDNVPPFSVVDAIDRLKEMLEEDKND